MFATGKVKLKVAASCSRTPGWVFRRTTMLAGAASSTVDEAARENSTVPTSASVMKTSWVELPVNVTD